MIELLERAFAALGRAPTHRELELVADALHSSEDEAAGSVLWRAAEDSGAFAALADAADECGSSGFVALDLVSTFTTTRARP